MFQKTYFMIYTRGFLLTTPLPLGKKIYYVWKSLYYTLFSWFFSLINKKSCYVGKGLTLYGFDFHFINGLFHENWIKNEYFFQSPQNNPIIIDAGANIGDSMLYFKYLYPDATIYSFEPDKKTFSYLEKNVLKNNLKNITLFNSALGTTDAPITFFYDNDPSYTHSTKSGRMSKNEILVPCVNILDFIKDKSIDLLKLDIEGGEYELLTHMDKHNGFQKIHSIVLEYHHHIPGESSLLGSFLQILEKNGYNYQIQADCFPLNIKNKYQDVHIFAYK